MNNYLSTQLFVPRGDFTEETARGFVALLQTKGFSLGQQPDAPVRYWDSRELDWIEVAGEEEIWAALATAEDWSIEFWRRWPDGGVEDLTFSLRGVLSQEQQQPYQTVSISSVGAEYHRKTQPYLIQSFYSWSMALANHTSPAYGWGGYQTGFGGGQPITTESIKQRGSQDIEWLNFLGSAYVQTIGLNRLLSTPVWWTDFLLNGGIVLCLAHNPEAMTMADAQRTAQYLGWNVAGTQ